MNEEIRNFQAAVFALDALPIGQEDRFTLRLIGNAPKPNVKPEATNTTEDN